MSKKRKRARVWTFFDEVAGKKTKVQCNLCQRILERGDKGCTTNTPSFEFIKIAMSKKPILLINKFTFSLTTSDQRYWYCSSRNNCNKCSARVRFDADGKMVHYDLKHSHSPPILYKQHDEYYAKKRILKDPYKTIKKLGEDRDVQILGSTRTFNLPHEELGFGKWKKEQPKIDVSFKFIKVSNVRRHMLLLGEYAFAQTTSDHRYWNCSKKSSKRRCSAKLRFDNAMNIVYYDLRHNHSPPRFCLQPNGEYARFKN